MVTTRQRRASTALPVLENRLDSAESTAGPFTLNRTDPKVSVSAARVDQQGLHVSLTIPLDSSVTPIVESGNGGQLSVDSLPTYHEPRTRSVSRRTTQNSRVSSPAPAASTAQAKHQQRPRPRNSQEAPVSPRKRRRHSGGGAPLNTQTRATVVDRIDPKSSSSRVIRATQKETDTPSTSRTPTASAASRRNRSSQARLRQSHSSIQHTTATEVPAQAAFHSHLSPQQGLVPSDQSIVETSLGEAEGGSLQSQAAVDLVVAPGTLCEGLTTQSDAIIEGTPIGCAAAHTNFANIFCHWWGEVVENVHGRLRVASRRVGAFMKGFPKHFCRLLTKCTWPLVCATVAVFWAKGFNWPTVLPVGLRWTLFGTKDVEVPPETHVNSRDGRFFLVDASKLDGCILDGHACPRTEGEICGFPIDAEMNDCVPLGRDVGARKSGGSIDYSHTSGTAPQMALGVSRILAQMASFGMPRLPTSEMQVSSAIYDTTEQEKATLCQSYYPLFNHDNDPGALLTDTPATYIITDSQGQISVTLSQPASVFAVAMETPAQATSDGQCGPLEANWFSVHVRLDERARHPCPAAVPGNGEQVALDIGGWCEVGNFQYRCISSRALQVFCLDAPYELFRSAGTQLGYQKTACDTSGGWLTDRVRFVLKSNWGAEATRVHRLRVLAAPGMP